MQHLFTPTLAWLCKLLTGQATADSLPPNQWPNIIAAAQQHGLGPLLAHVVRHQQFQPPGGEPWPGLLAMVRQQAGGQAVLEGAMAQVERTLGQADIETLWLKGAALAHTVYPDPLLRPMGDLDLLVPYERREVALEAVFSLDYHHRQPDSGRLFGTGDALYEQYAHHYHLVGGPADAVVLEIHFRLLADSSRPSPRPEGWFWTQKQQMTTSFGSFWTLKPEAHLLYLCAHTILQHGAANFYLQRYLDIHMLLTNAALDWRRVIEQAAALRWTYAVEVALGDCLRWFGTPLPAGTLTNLAMHRPPDENIGRVVRQRKPGALLESELRKLKMLPPRQRARMLSRSFFPTAAYMRQRYKVKTGRAVSPYYLYRWGWLLWGTARGIWNRLVWWLARR